MLSLAHNPNHLSRSFLKNIGALFAAIAVLVLSASGISVAGVNKKNGNFYITYTDLIVGFPEFNVARTYNSKSNQTLLFGVGWGSDFETKLEVAADGSVVITENGSGARRFYNPPNLQADERKQVIETMLSAMEAAGWITSDAALHDARKHLIENANERRNLQKTLVRFDLMPARDIPIGERLTSSATPGVTVEREAGGYYRRHPNGHERFNLEGQLVEFVDKDGSGYRLRRAANGHLREFILSNGATIDVSTNTNGQITRLSSGGETATYEYDDKNQLIRATNAANTTYKYEYDERSNMRFIRYENGKYQEMAYEKDQFLTSMVRERDGKTTRYEYGKNPITEPDIVQHYYTRTRVFNSETDTVPTTEQLLTYRIGKNRFGNKYTASIENIVNGNTTMRRYHPCGQPILIETRNRRAEFDYNDACRLTYKKTEKEEIRLEYEGRNGKISRVEKTNLRRNTTHVTEFTYNLRGSLETAKDSRGRSVALEYDGKAIKSMTNEKNEVIVFEMNAFEKPVKILIKGVGQIDIKYDSAGEISSIKSEQGHKMALRVTQAFQAMLSLVKPAGVNFNL